MNQEITVPKDQLIEILLKNRDKHRQVFAAALEGYREEAITWLGRTIDKARANPARVPDLKFGCQPPRDYTGAYDRKIAMLRMHTGKTYDLDERDYAQYVEDDWGWKRQFLDTSSVYAAATVTEVYGAEVIE